MDFIQAIKNAKNDGPFLLLTEGGVEGFTDLALCEERMAGLEGEPFALVRWLRSGGQSKNVQASPQPDRALTLNETSIRDSLEKIARHLKAGEMTEAKAALDALDFGRLFRTVQDPTKASRTDNAMPAFNTNRARVVGDYLSNLSYHMRLGDAASAAEEAEKALKRWVDDR